MRNNDHGISPDKKMLVISNFDKIDSENKTYKSSIYTLPINGGTLIKKKLAFLLAWLESNGKTHWCTNEIENFDTIPVDGGEEKD
jgi:hypothetical protein